MGRSARRCGWAGRCCASAGAAAPVEVAGEWGALQLPALAAAGRVADAGRRLAGVLFDQAAQELLAAVVDRLPPGDTVEVVLSAAGPLLSLPVELIRLATEAGSEVGPLGLQPGVSLHRRPPRPAAAAARCRCRVRSCLRRRACRVR